MLQGEKLRAIVFRARRAPRADDSGRSRGLLAGSVAAWSVAAVGTAVFAYFGATGIEARSEFGCATGCADDHYQTVHQDFVAADAALGIAIGSAVVATVLLVVRASAGPRSSSGAALGFVSSSGFGVRFLMGRDDETRTLLRLFGRPRLWRPWASFCASRRAPTAAAAWRSAALSASSSEQRRELRAAALRSPRVAASLRRRERRAGGEPPCASVDLRIPQRDWLRQLG